MKDLFYQGGFLFMSILTLLLIIAVAWAVFHFVKAVKHPESGAKLMMVHTKSFGLLALIFGFLGQMIGLMMAFSAIEQATDISPRIIYGGLKVSMITPMYGIIIYIISILIWLGMDVYLNKKIV